MRLSTWPRLRKDFVRACDTPNDHFSAENPGEVPYLGNDTAQTQVWEYSQHYS